jgi:hypothetical protein
MHMQNCYRSIHNKIFKKFKLPPLPPLSSIQYFLYDWSIRIVLNGIFHYFPKLSCTYKRICMNRFIFFHPLPPICLNPNLVFCNTIMIFNIHFFVFLIMIFQVTIYGFKQKQRMSQLQLMDIYIQRWVQTSYSILSRKGYEI